MNIVDCLQQEAMSAKADKKYTKHLDLRPIMSIVSSICDDNILSLDVSELTQYHIDSIFKSLSNNYAKTTVNKIFKYLKISFEKNNNQRNYKWPIHTIEANNKRIYPEEYWLKYKEYDGTIDKEMIVLKALLLIKIIGISYDELTQVNTKSLKSITGKMYIVTDQKKYLLDNNGIKIVKYMLERYANSNGIIFPISKFYRDVNAKKFDRLSKNLVRRVSRQINEPFDEQNLTDAWLNHTCINHAGLRAKMMLDFHFLCQNIPFTSIARLRKDDIFKRDGKYYAIYRIPNSADKRTIELDKAALNVIDYFNQNEPGLDDYVFPVIDNPYIPEEELDVHIKNKKSSVLRQIKKIIKKVGIPDEYSNLNFSKSFVVE